MENDIIKQLLRENLKTPKKERFNDEIIKKLNVEPKKKRQPLFNEKSILNSFLFVAAFVLFFYLQQASTLEADVILIGIAFSAVPLYLLLFNKIYSLKN